MRFIREIYRLLKNNMRSLVIFEAIYKGVMLAVSIPTLYICLQRLLEYEGIKYLADDTIAVMLKNPLTYLACIVLFVVTIFTTTIDIAAIVACYAASYNGKDMKVWQMFYEGFRNAFRLFRFKNTMMIIEIAMIIPAINIAAIFGYLSTTQMPSFVINYIESRRWLIVLLAVAYVIVVLLAFRGIFAVYEFVVNKKSYKESAAQSRSLNRGHYLRNLFTSILWQAVMFLVAALISAIATGISFGIIKLLCPVEYQYKSAVMTIFIVVTIVFGFLSLISVPLVFAQLSYRYYSYKNSTDKSEKEYFVEEPNRKLNKKRLAIFVAAAVVLTNATAIFLNVGEDVFGGFSFFNHPDVAAHRGSSVYAPENSIPAFEKAIEQGVDWIELDVHQTSDGVVVVTHDSSIKRIAGVDKKVYNLTYDELQEYDVGSWFSEEYEGLKVATLDEVVKLCKGKVKLNIELKPTGHEKDFEQHVIDIIHENEIENECVIASMNPQALKNVKKLDDTVKTLYVCYVAAGNVKYIEFADGYSVNASFVTSILVNRVHELGKELFVWTVNDRDIVRNMMNMNADIIITDNPVMVQEVIDYEYIDARLGSIVDMFFDRTEDIGYVQGEDSP